MRECGRAKRPSQIVRVATGRFGAVKGPHYETGMVGRTAKHLVAVLNQFRARLNWQKRPEKLDRGRDTVPTCL